MKQKDLAVIISSVVVSGILALILSAALINSPQNRSQKAEVVAPIVADFPVPDRKYFNEDSIDPTQLIRIGDSTNKSPFNDD